MVLSCCLTTSGRVESKTVKQKKYQTVESKLSSQTKKLIKEINSCKDEDKLFLGYSRKTYEELVNYLYSDSHLEFTDGINITEIPIVQKRIRKVKRVNNILYRRVKKINKAKSIKKIKSLKTIYSYNKYIRKKMMYSIFYMDIYSCTTEGTCISYSVMLDVMCNISNIPCDIYAGWDSKTSGHCWNKIKIKGKWYWSDPCWFDSMYGNEYKFARKLWRDHRKFKGLNKYKVDIPY